MKLFRFFTYSKSCFFLTAFLLCFQTHSVFSQTVNLSKTNQYSVVNLQLRDAIELALQNHILVRMAHEKISESEGLRMQAFSDLIPHISGAIYQQRVWHENLAAMGLESAGVIGPFNDFDARFMFTQKLLDMSAIYKSKAGYISFEIAKLEDEFAQQKVFLIVILSYLETLRTYNNLKAEMADYSLARRLLSQAEHQHEVGMATGVDVARAKTRAAQEKLRLSQGKLFYNEAKLKLLRTTGLSYKTNIRLVDSLSFFEEHLSGVDDEVSLAKKNRIETRIFEKNISLGKYKLNEASLQRIPKLELTADYGRNGSEIDKTAITGQGLIKASVPIFEGGLIQGQIRQAESNKKQAELAFDDIEEQIEEDVRLAVMRIKTSKEKILSAKQVVVLAHKEFEMAKDRFAAGVEDNVAVLNSQAVLENAYDNYIEALAEYHTARVNLYSAIGQVDKFCLESLSEKEKK